MKRSVFGTALFRFTVALLVVAGLLWPLIPAAAQGTAPDSPRAGLRLEGTFIQYQDGMKTMDAAAWNRELDAMRRAHLHILIVQWFQNNSASFLPSGISMPDATEAILDYADRHSMEVYLGLATDDAWWTRAVDPAYQKEAAKVSISLAKRVSARYGRHPSFAGWYLPQELSAGAFSSAQIDQLARFFGQISAACKALTPGKPVLVSCFFGSGQPVTSVEPDYDRLLKAADIDILLLQDGAGAEARDNNVDSVVPYFRALRSACRKNGVTLWSDLECFRRVTEKPLQFAPTDAARIGRQLAAEAPFVRRVITFDFFHYMSPYRGAPQRTLYEHYLHDFVDRPFFPATGAAVEIKQWPEGARSCP